MNLRFLKVAQSEVDDAFAWYETQSHGLGTRFMDDFDRAVRRVAVYPLASAEIEDGLRRCLLSRFPYGITVLILRQLLLLQLPICIESRVIGLTGCFNGKSNCNNMRR